MAVASVSGGVVLFVAALSGCGGGEVGGLVDQAVAGDFGGADRSAVADLLGGDSSTSADGGAPVDQGVSLDQGTPVDQAGAVDQGAADQAKPADLVTSSDFGGIPCGNQTCGMGQLCCATMNGSMCANSCPDGGLALRCDGPEECGGNPCCVAVQQGVTSGAMCTNQMTSCPPMINFQTQSGQSRLCHVDGDCTSGVQNPQLRDCCTVTQNGQKVHLCFDQQLIGFVNGTCP